MASHTPQRGGRAFALSALAALALLLSACRNGQAERENAKADSVTTALSNRIFARPAYCDSVFRLIQEQTTDSAVWYRIALNRASARRILGDSAEAERLYGSVRLFCERNKKQHRLEGEYWNHLGVNTRMEGKITEAETCYRQAVRLLSVPPKKRPLIVAVSNLADIYAMTGRLPLAAQCYRRALFLCDSLGESHERTAILTGLARVYIDMENFGEAHACLAKARGGVGRESLQTRFYYYNTLGNCLYLQQRYPEAIAAFRQSRDLVSELRSPLYRIQTDVNLGETLLMQGRTDEAAQHIGNCRQYALAHAGELDSQTHFYINSLAADLAMARGDEAGAARILKGAEPDTTNISPRYLMLHFRRLEHYAAERRDWERAYRMQREAGRYADSLRNIQTINAVAEMELRYRRDSTLVRQRLALAESEARNARQNIFVVSATAAVVVCVFAAVILMLVYRQRTRQKLKLQMEKMTELRMGIVRNRVSPHYVFNVLNTILPKLRNYAEVAFPLELLIDVLRGNLLASGKVETPLNVEVELVKNFVRLHQCCRGGFPAVAWHFGEGMEGSTRPIPAMSLEIPVENAFKHAFPAPTAESRIDITIETGADGTLRIEVRDNGTGYNPGAIRPTGRDTGTGLRLISRTIGILNQYNRQAASFTISALSPHGTAVTLLLPKGFSCTPLGIGGGRNASF